MWINFGKPFSDHVSFRSPSPSPKAFRSTVSPSENPHCRRLFRRNPFPTPTIPSGVQGGDLQVLSQHRRENLSHAPAMLVSSPAAWTSRASTWGRVEHFPATRFHLQPCLTSSSDSPSVLMPSEPCKCIFLGFLSPLAL